MTDTKDRMTAFEEHLTGGMKHNEILFLNHDDDGQQMVMFMMDAEYDPVRLVFDFDGGVQIMADGHKWHSFTPEQLEFIADQTRFASAIFQHIAVNLPEEHEGEESEEIWCARRESDFVELMLDCVC